MPTQFTFFALLIIAASDQARGNAATQQLPNAVAADALNTFAVPLSPAGSAPATHYMAAGAFRPAAWTKLQQVAATFTGSTVAQYDPVADPGFPERTLASLGLKRIFTLPGG